MHCVWKPQCYGAAANGAVVGTLCAYLPVDVLLPCRLSCFRPLHAGGGVQTRAAVETIGSRTKLSDHTCTKPPNSLLGESAVAFRLTKHMHTCTPTPLHTQTHTVAHLHEQHTWQAAGGASCASCCHRGPPPRGSLVVRVPKQTRSC